MNAHIFLLTCILALLFTSIPTDGVKQEKSKNGGKLIDSTNTTLSIDSDIKKVQKVTTIGSDNALSNVTKIAEKASYPKKVQSLKKRPAKAPTSAAAAPPNGKNKRKKVVDVAAVFKDLPADDVEFIKELDKQFQLHGDKIKIKVEHDNSTEAEKQNSKRTIDGELGYGAYHAQNGYVYERPKFMFYPYSQRSIPADAPGYYPPKTDVSIEPSYSYELKPQTYVQEQQSPQILDVPRHPQQPQQPQQEEQHGGYEEPVIVLRIPGPTKYASHLQTLLQQYLEIRAAQYLRILEESEKQQQHQQQYAPQQQDYATQQQEYAPQHVQQQQQEYAPQHAQQEEYVTQQQEYALQHAQHQQQQQHHHEQHSQHIAYQEQVQQQQHADAPAQGYIEPTLELQPPAHEPHSGAQQAPADDDRGYAPEVKYAHQIAPTPQPVVYAEIDQVYQNYKKRLNAQQHQQALHQQHLQQQQQQHEQHAVQQVEYAPQQQVELEQHQKLPHGGQQQYYVQAAQQPESAPQYYYLPAAQVSSHGPHHYQNIYFMSIAPQAQAAYNGHAAQEAPLQQQPIYVQDEDLQQHQHQHQEHEQLSAHAATGLNENSPRQTHTKIIYTHNAEKGAADYAGGFALPSIRPFERHAGTSAAAAYHQQQQAQEQHEQLEHEPHHQQQEQQQQQYDYDSEVASEQHEPSAAISPRPFNYHAHSAKAARRRNRKRGTATTTTSATTTTEAEVDEHLEKIREFVRENLGARMSTAVEFKTSALVKSSRV